MRVLLIWLILLAAVALEYPISLATVRSISMRRAPEELARLLGVPGFNSNNISARYQFISLDGWTFGKGCKRACQLWSNAQKYFGKATRFGASTSDIQTYLRKLYNHSGTKLLVTAFGSNEFPYTERIDWKQAADKLALFVKSNYLDGAVIEFEDVSAILGEDAVTSPASNWLVNFTEELRKQLVSETIVIQLYASLLQPTLQLLQSIISLGASTDFTVVKYYDVAGGDYTTVDSTFNQAIIYKGTALQELMANGLRGNMLVLGKPSSVDDSLTPQAFIDGAVLGQAMSAMYSKGWYAGYACNDLANDLLGTYLQAATKGLTTLCDDSALCN